MSIYAYGKGPYGAGPYGGLQTPPPPVVSVIAGAPPTAKKSSLGALIASGAQVIPLSNQPNQTISVSLNIDGNVVDHFLFLHYNEIAGYWTLAIEDFQGNTVLDSIPLVTGNEPAGNILGQYAYLGIGSAFIVAASALETTDYPGFANLGTDYVLIWSNTPAS